MSSQLRGFAAVFFFLFFGPFRLLERNSVCLADQIRRGEPATVNLMHGRNLAHYGAVSTVRGFVFALHNSANNELIAGPLPSDITLAQLSVE